MVHYLKDARKWVHEERSDLGKGKSEWYSQTQTVEQKGGKRREAK